MVFFFKQKTAYEMRISDWSSDVCSSDLAGSKSWCFTSNTRRFPRTGASSHPMTYVLFDVDTCDELTLMDQLTNSTSRLAMGRPKKRMYAFSNRASNRAASLASKERKSTRLNSSH